MGQTQVSTGRALVTHMIDYLLEHPVQLPDDVDAITRPSACELAGITVDACKYWASLGLVPNKRKYSLNDVRLLAKVKEMTKMGMKPSAIQSLLEQAEVSLVENTG